MRGNAVGCLVQDDVIDGMRADGAERVAREFTELIPAHAQFLAERLHVDAVARAQVAHRDAQFLLGLAFAQPPIQAVERFLLLLRGFGVETTVLAVDGQPDSKVRCAYPLQRQPPEFADTVGEARRDIERERHLVLAQHRVRP